MAEFIRKLTAFTQEIDLLRRARRPKNKQHQKFNQDHQTQTHRGQSPHIPLYEVMSDIPAAAKAYRGQDQTLEHGSERGQGSHMRLKPGLNACRAGKRPFLL